MRPIIYADHNATTPPSPSSLKAMTEAFGCWGNASSAHKMGRQAAELIENARHRVAQLTGAAPAEVIFTSGGSEANTLALMGSYFLNPEIKILTSGVEHSSVRDTLTFLASRGAQIQNVRVLPSGELDLADFERRLDEFKPDLVSLMTANNETGVVFPIPEVGALCSQSNTVFHTDAVQALGKISSDFWAQADLVSLTAHKIYGPKGTGALIVRKGNKLAPTHFGGSQEIKRRGGTEGVIGIAGFGGACTDLPGATELLHLETLRDSFERRLRDNLDEISFPGSPARRLPNTSNLRIDGLPNEVLLSALDLDGVCVSAGSACSSGSISASHVLLEMGLDREAAKQCLRFSWGRQTTAEDIDTVASLVLHHVARIRSRTRTRRAV